MVSIISFIRSFSVSFPAAEGTDIAGYVVHACPASQFVQGDLLPSESNLIYKGPDPNMFYTIPEGVMGGQWGLKVAAYDTFGLDEVNYSELYTFTVSTLDPLDQVPPPVPFFIALTTGVEASGAVDNIYIDASWGIEEEPWDFLHYTLAYRRVGASNWNEHTTTETQHRLTNLVGGVSYEFKIRGVDQWNNASEYSDVEVVIAAKDTTPPAKPTGIEATASMRTMFLKWDNNTEVDFSTYLVQVSTHSDMSSPVETYTRSTFYTFTGEVGNTYYARVAAVDYSQNRSAWSDIVTATPGYVAPADIDNFAIDASKMFNYVPVIKEAQSSVWIANSPAGGISWNAHTVVYKSAVFDIGAGNTTDTYVYGTFSGAGGDLNYQTSNTQPATGNDTFVMAKNTAGRLEVVWNSEANVVIGSAYIMEGAIGNAQVGTLAADKITTGTLDCGPLTVTNLTFTDIDGSISWGDSRLTDKPTSVADLNATDGTKLTYIGSTGLYSGTINANSINAGNYTGAGIGIGEAKIKLDGTHSRITVANSAGTVSDMVTIGKLATSNYGISVKNKDGLQVFKVDQDGAVITNATVGTLDCTTATLTGLKVGNSAGAGYIALAPDAYISWTQVNDRPTTLDTLDSTAASTLSTAYSTATTAYSTATTAYSTATTANSTATTANSTATTANTTANRAATHIDANGIYTGTLTAKQLTSGSIVTEGGYLLSAVSAGATVLQLSDVSSFPPSGTGYILDRENDKDTITWTGKSGNSLTGCAGVLSHGAAAAVIPKAPCVAFVKGSNELRVYGYNTTANTYSTTEQLFTCGIKDVGDGGSGTTDNAIMRVGNGTFSRGVAAYFETANPGIYGVGDWNWIHHSTYTSANTARIINYAVFPSASWSAGLIVENHNPYFVPDDGYGSGNYWTSSNSADGVVGRGSRFGIRGINGSNYTGSGITGFSGGAGVYGISMVYSGTGVEGDATTSLNGTGVEGRGSSVGVYGRGTGIGVHGSGDWADFYASGSGTNYASFTGSHDALVLKTLLYVQGDIAIDSKIVRLASMTQGISEVALTTQVKQRNVIGVFGSRNAFNQERVPAGLKLYSQNDSIPDYAMLETLYDTCFVHSIGEGALNVCKEGGNIQAGDYICSSSRPGKGMRQDDDLLHNYTVAKAREDCIWQEDEDDIRMIACTYHCG